MIKNGYVVSIGDFCITSKVLERTKMRKESFPFDCIGPNHFFVSFFISFVSISPAIDKMALFGL